MNFEKGAKTILSLEKALRLIEIMAQEAKPIRLMDLAAAAELPASTALRLLHTLQENGYVLQEEVSSRYYLSLKLFHISNQYTASISVANIARPYLNELATETGHSVNLAVPQGDTAVILDVINGFSEAELIITRPGRIIPLYCSAIGRALLFDHTSEQISEYWKNISPVSYTPLTTTSLNTLKEKLAQMHAYGYAYDPGELRSGIAGFGAPIRSGGRIVASISVAELNSSLTPEIINFLGTSISQTARKISMQM